MNWPLFLSVFSLIFIAELPDKTAFATLLMATRGKPYAIFAGVACAFVVQSGVAIAFGSVISLLPEKWVHLTAGILYLGFAWHTWFHQEEEEEEIEEEIEEESLSTTNRKNSEWQLFFTNFSKAFVVIFIAEWGDITQIATATMAAKYHHDLLTVFIAATLALWSVTAIAIVVGHRLKHVLHSTVLTKISTAVFLIIGIYFIYTWF